MLYFYIITECFGAVLLFLLGFAHLEALYFARDLLLVLIVVLHLILVAYYGRINWILASIILIILLSSFWSIYNLHNLQLTIYGIKLAIPLIIGGILFEQKIDIDIIKHKRTFKYLFILTILGVIANAFFYFPWESISLKIGEFDVEGSRLWTQYGTTFRRLAGFTRGSNSAASIAALLYIPIFVTTKGSFNKLFIFIITFIAILFTTMKSVLLGFLIINVLFVLRQISILSKIYPLLIFLFVSIIPLVSQNLINKLSEDNIFMFSLWDRMQGAWPEAVELVKDSGNLVLGRGIGGLGASQIYFEKELYNPGDNMFIHIWANYGILLFILLVGIFYLATKLKIRNNKFHMVIFLFISFLITNGLTSAITIGSLQNIVLVYSLLFIYHTYKNEKRFRYNYNS